MDKFSAHQVINGTWGEIWIDGTYMTEVKAFETKVTLDKTDVNMTRRLAKVQKVIGYSCTGQLTPNKVSFFYQEIK